MTIPAGAGEWTQHMDPADLVDYKGNFTPLLDVENGEAIDTFTIALMPEAILLGVNIVDAAPRVASKIEDNRKIRVWFDVDEAKREDPIFEGAGVAVGVVFTVQTTSNPFRRRQRTLKLTVKQQ